MRLKIKGEITPERLAEAYAKALAHLQSVVPDAKFYGANLYLTPFDADGMPFDLVDGRGNSVVITVSAPPGTLVKPALSAEAEQRREEARESERQRQLQNDNLRRQHEEEHERRYLARVAREEKAKKAHDTLNSITLGLLNSQPEELVAALNGVIQATWQNLQPVETHGVNKGVAKPVPDFSILDGRLLLATKAWRQPKFVLNPVGSLKKEIIAPVWTYEAWLVATVGFLSVLERLNGSLPEEVTGDHLPKVQISSAI